MEVSPGEDAGADDQDPGRGPLIETDKDTIKEMNNTLLIVNELADLDGLMQEYLRKVTP